jgi:hypothetical protein
MTKRRDEALNAARYHFSNWLVHNWSRAGLVLAAGLFILTPLVFKSSGLAVSLIYLWLPFICFECAETVHEQSNNPVAGGYF